MSLRLSYGVESPSALFRHFYYEAFHSVLGKSVPGGWRYLLYDRLHRNGLTDSAKLLRLALRAPRRCTTSSSREGESPSVPAGPRPARAEPSRAEPSRAEPSQAKRGITRALTHIPHYTQPYAGNVLELIPAPAICFACLKCLRPLCVPGESPCRAVLQALFWRRSVSGGEGGERW